MPIGSQSPPAPNTHAPSTPTALHTAGEATRTAILESEPVPRPFIKLPNASTRAQTGSQSPLAEITPAQSKKTPKKTCCFAGANTKKTRRHGQSSCLSFQAQAPSPADKVTPALSEAKNPTNSSVLAPIPTTNLAPRRPLRTSRCIPMIRNGAQSVPEQNIPAQSKQDSPNAGDKMPASSPPPQKPSHPVMDTHALSTTINRLSAGEAPFTAEPASATTFKQPSPPPSPGPTDHPTTSSRPLSDYHVNVGYKRGKSL